MNGIEVVTTAPVIPSKYDIIPIHGSDISAFKRCRRYWDWTSPSRNNLRKKVSINGVNMALWFGTGIHYALEMYYSPVLQRDPVEAFKTWYTFQWEGGVVGEEWLERTYDIHPRIEDRGHDLTMYRIQGLRDILPNMEEVQEEFQQHYELGVGMLEFYKDWAPRNDDFICVAAESMFSIPLGFETVDKREESPNYGKKLEVHARGKRDAVIYFPDYDKFGVIDHKTAARVDEDYFRKLEKDEQCNTYLWATMEEAKHEGRPWSGHMVDRVLYTALRKNYPKPPTWNTNGKSLSIDRSKEGTTAELFEQTIKDNEVLHDWFRNNEKAQAYYTYLCEMGDANFVQRDIVTRNRYEVAATQRHIEMIAREMTGEPAIYPNPSGTFSCIQCAFRSPCIAADDGSDWEGMLTDGYELNRDR